MSYPNPDLPPFEAENFEWAKAVADAFVKGITFEQLGSPKCDPHHACYAHLWGAMICAIEAGRPAVLAAMFRECADALEAGAEWGWGGELQ